MNNKGFAYLRIYQEIRDNIVDGAYVYGTKLPSKRALADSRNVSVITIQRAYSILEDEGYIESRERSGYFVAYKKTDSFLSFPDHEQNSNQPAPLGGGALLLVGFGAAYAAAKRRKK